MEGRIRVTAKTVDDAITEALIQLGVTSDRLEYDVIEKGSSGFLGIGVKQAVIEAWRKPEPKVDLNEIVEETEVEEQEQTKDVIPDTTEPLQSEQISSEKKRSAKESVSNKPKQKQSLSEVQEETKQAVECFLKDTLQAMGKKVELTTSIDAEGALCIDMKGHHMGILIGKHGQTLDALQYLANRVANKHQDGYVRVKLDTENYRARREDTLKNLAKNIAYKVKKTQKSVALEPMNPSERRIIHSALQGDAKVTTHSEGEEPYRKVVISIKK
jgi:spoIIIJ-associated protein